MKRSRGFIDLPLALLLAAAFGLAVAWVFIAVDLSRQRDACVRKGGVWSGKLCIRPEAVLPIEILP